MRKPCTYETQHRVPRLLPMIGSRTGPRTLLPAGARCVSAAARGIALLLLVVGLTRGAACADPPSLGQILEGCRSSSDRVRSSQGTFVIEFREYGNDAAARAQRLGTRLEGSWIASGESLREETVRVFPPLSGRGSAGREGRRRRDGSPETAPAGPRHGRITQIVVFNGTEGRVVQYQDKRLEADEPLSGKGAAQQALGLAEFWKWLGIAPRGTSPARRLTFPTAELDPEIIGLERINGVECVKVRSRHETVVSEITWWVAPEYGYTVLRRDRVRYYPPGQGLRAGQYVLVRDRVARMQPCGSGIYLPAEVERTVAWMNADGSVARILRRFRFSLGEVKVNQPVKADAFSTPGPSSGSRKIEAEDG